MNSSLAHRALWLVLGLTVALGITTDPVHAQRTWIVDSANGPGTDFPDLHLAVNAASPGDTIIVRPGLSQQSAPYGVGDINIGVRIVAPGNVRPWVRGNGTVRIPAGQLFILDNVRFGGPQGYQGLQIQSSSGTVILSRLYQEWWDYSGVGQALACARVVWTDCTMTSHWGACISVGRENTGYGTAPSTVYVLDSRMEILYSGDSRYLLWPYGGIDLESGSMAWIVNTYAKGGEGFNSPYTLWPMPGLEVKSGARAVVAGRSEFVGGLDYRNGQLFRVPGIRVFSDPRYPQWGHGLIALDPLTRSDGPRYTEGGRYEVLHEMPTVSPDDAIRGQPQAVRMIGPSNGIMALFASLLTPRPPLVTPIGDIWLDPATTILIGGGAPDQNRDLVLHTSIPSWLPTGEVIVYQAIAATPTSWLELSIPGFAVVQ